MAFVEWLTDELIELEALSVIQPLTRTRPSVMISTLHKWAFKNTITVICYQDKEGYRSEGSENIKMSQGDSEVVGKVYTETVIIPRETEVDCACSDRSISQGHRQGSRLLDNDVASGQGVLDKYHRGAGAETSITCDIMQCFKRSCKDIQPEYVDWGYRGGGLIYDPPLLERTLKLGKDDNDYLTAQIIEAMVKQIDLDMYRRDTLPEEGAMINAIMTQSKMKTALDHGRKINKEENKLLMGLQVMQKHLLAPDLFSEDGEYIGDENEEQDAEILFDDYRDNAELITGDKLEGLQEETVDRGEPRNDEQELQIRNEEGIGDNIVGTKEGDREVQGDEVNYRVL